MNVFDDLLKTGAKVIDSTAKVAENLVEKGKTKANMMSLQNELAKAQRQLGAFVYASRKSGVEDNDQLMQYIGRIADIEVQLNYYKTEEMVDVEITPICPECGAEVKEDAMFCVRCGAKLSEPEA